MRHLRLDDGLQLTLADRGLGRACGKAILVGEHFVLHGVRAVALPVRSRQVEVALTSAPDGAGIRYAGPPEGAALALAMCGSLGLPELAARHGVGIAVSVSGDLPLAAGLGSSAALSVALVRASDALVSATSDPDAVRTRAHALEQLAHGRASGIDDAVIALQRPVLFDPRQVGDARFGWPEVPSAPPLWVAWTRRERSTREAVAAVAALRETHPEAFASAHRIASEAVADALPALAQGDWTRLGDAMNLAHGALEAVGVVTPTHAAMVNAARAAGASGAKVTGAGCGGAILVLGPRTLDLSGLLDLPGVEGCFYTGGES
jgi:mevalonate kinase